MLGFLWMHVLDPFQWLVSCYALVVPFLVLCLHIVCTPSSVLNPVHIHVQYMSPWLPLHAAHFLLNLDTRVSGGTHPSLIRAFSSTTVFYLIVVSTVLLLLTLKGWIQDYIQVAGDRLTLLYVYIAYVFHVVLWNVKLRECSRCTCMLTCMALDAIRSWYGFCLFLYLLFKSRDIVYVWLLLYCFSHMHKLAWLLVNTKQPLSVGNLSLGFIILAAAMQYFCGISACVCDDRQPLL